MAANVFCESGFLGAATIIVATLTCAAFCKAERKIAIGWAREKEFFSKKSEWSLLK